MTSLTKDARFFVDGVTKYLHGSSANDWMLPKVTAALHKITASARMEKTAVVESAVRLTAREKRRIVTFLSRLLTHTVTLACRINKERISGLRIVVGDWIVDTTVAGQIEAMKEQLIA